MLYFQDASTLLLGNKHVAQPIRVTFEREQVGCWETGPAKQAWQLTLPNSQCALNFPHAVHATPLWTELHLGPGESQSGPPPAVHTDPTLACTCPCVSVSSLEECGRCSVGLLRVEKVGAVGCRVFVQLGYQEFEGNLSGDRTK